MAAAAPDSYCTVLFSTEKAISSNATQEGIMKDLESNDPKVKVSALKQAILMLLAGESLPRVLMHVIRFCINTEDHLLKKYMMLYWEIVKKYDASKKLLPEMILVCNALLNDLKSPNEYVRGCMLRFLCKLREPELLEPLIPAIKQCLEHRHAFVRRNAALAVFSIHHAFGQQLLPDGPELIDKFLQTETDAGARRAGFLFLLNEAEDVAAAFLEERAEDIHRYGDGFALGVLELARKVCRRDPAQKSRFVRALFAMLASESPAVAYEAAWTLAGLSAAPTAVRAAAGAYASLLNSQSDNNLKLILLERLAELRRAGHAKVLREAQVGMDLLRAMAGSPNIDVCRRALAGALDLLSPRNIEEVVQVLKREVVKTQETDLDKGKEYQAALIAALHRCATRFPVVAEAAVATLADFLRGDAALSVVLFVRDIGEQYPELRNSVLAKLISNFGEMTQAPVLGAAVWLLGEYSEPGPLLDQAWAELLANLGEPPYAAAAPVEEEGKGKGEEKAAAGGGGGGGGAVTSRNVVLSDGTYATQSVVTAAPAAPAEKDAPGLRKHVAAGDCFLCAALGAALTKLALRRLAAAEGEGGPAAAEGAKAAQLRALRALCGLAAALQARERAQPGAQADALERLQLCARALLDPEGCALAREALEKDGRAAFARLLRAREAAAGRGPDGAEKEKGVPQRAAADDLISFRQLRGAGARGAEYDLDDGDDLTKATGEGEGGPGGGPALRHVHQLSGFADPVYAEAVVTVHDYDIVLELLVINRTPNTLTNLTVELATMGDLKLVERPQSYTIGPLDQRTIRANIKVSSTETGHIFGTIVYENSSTAEKTYINLDDIHLDVMDYIRPGRVTDDAFRRMWEEFEWENKVAINTQFLDLQAYLAHVVENTNMTCLTPTAGLGSKSAFLAANLYAKSIFGEDVLVNVSVEKKDDADGKLSGYVRIRSKTQGIALSLGDRITLVQRGPSQAEKP